MLLLATSALANGLTAHQWVTLEAIDALPDGPLKDVVTDEDNRAALLTGNCFPDGGYAVGHAYGEAAHWEPFQIAYLRWIRDSYAPGEAGRRPAQRTRDASDGLRPPTFTDDWEVGVGEEQEKNHGRHHNQHGGDDPSDGLGPLRHQVTMIGPGSGSVGGSPGVSGPPPSNSHEQRAQVQSEYANWQLP